MIRIISRKSGGGGGKSAPPPAAPAAAAAVAPVVEDIGPDPAMQAELEKQRAQRFQAGKTGANSDITGSGTDTTNTTGTETTTGSNSTILGA